MKNIALIGLGPHARRIYYPYLERRRSAKGDLCLKLVVELDINRHTVEDYLRSTQMQPERIVYLPSKTHINPDRIDPEVERLLDALHITHAILATEPKAHKVYLEELIRKKIPVLTDKPITAPVDLTPDPRFTGNKHKFDAARKIKTDAVELVELIKSHPGARVLVMAPRRHHQGFELVRQRLDEIIRQYRVPISYLLIHHSDGYWNMPQELLSREGHPYKYGYGKLMHSGYHSVDLLHLFIGLNLQLEDKRPDSVNVFSQALRPIDHFEILGEADYKRLLGDGNFSFPSNTHGEDDLATYGELDSYSQFQFLRDGKVMTTAQLSLMQSGFSQRAWSSLPVDTFKGNGKVHQELINIHIGPLFNIQVHSYRAAQDHEEFATEEGVGGKDHFDIYVFRNSNLLGGKPFELIEFGRNHKQAHANDPYYLEHSEAPKYEILDQLLDNLPSSSELESHIATTALMAALYVNQAKQQFGEIPFSSYKFEEIYPD